MTKYLHLIKENPEEFKKIFKEKYNGELIYLSETGSVLHGTNSNKSDQDYKGIYIPSLENLIQQNMKTLQFKTNEEKNNNQDIDLDLFPLFSFIDKTKKMESNNTELLFSMFANKIIIETECSKEIKRNYKYLISYDIRQFTGFAMSMAYRYSDKGDRLREVYALKDFFEKEMKDLSKNQKKKIAISKLNLEEFTKDKEYINIIEFQGGDNTKALYLEVLNSKFILSNKIGHTYNRIVDILSSFGARAEKAKESGGLDRKAFSHALRAILQAKEILETGFLKYPLTYAAQVKKLKFDTTLTKDDLTNIIEEEFQDLLNLNPSIEFHDNTVAEELKVSIFKKSLSKELVF
jgi:predicted nucleotidyltransferase